MKVKNFTLINIPRTFNKHLNSSHLKNLKDQHKRVEFFSFESLKKWVEYNLYKHGEHRKKQKQTTNILYLQVLPKLLSKYAFKPTAQLQCGAKYLQIHNPKCNKASFYSILDR